MDALAKAIIWIPPLLLAITFHEAAHGFAAFRYGDDTAKSRGRLTLNPFAHIDPFGTVILPLLLLILPGGFIFGYAKPVPVNVAALANPRWDMAKVAVAGPAMNFVLALASVLSIPLVLKLPGISSEIVMNMVEISIYFNILLGVFNLLPMPPLDGGRILAAVLPSSAAPILAVLERLGFLIVIGLFFLLPMLLSQVGIRLDPFGALVLQPTMWLSKSLMGLVA